MAAPPMHDGEVEVRVEVLRRGLAEQCPHLADRPLRAGPTTGTVNALFRFSDDLCVRIPRLGDGVASLEKELEWLPRLAPALPVEVPEPVFVGDPGPGCAVPWAVLRWIDGEAPVPDSLHDEVDLAGTWWRARGVALHQARRGSVTRGWGLSQPTRHRAVGRPQS